MPSEISSLLFGTTLALDYGSKVLNIFPKF